jgi:hypothetical protein
MLMFSFMVMSICDSTANKTFCEVIVGKMSHQLLRERRITEDFSSNIKISDVYILPRMFMVGKQL